MADTGDCIAIPYVVSTPQMTELELSDKFGEVGRVCLLRAARRTANIVTRTYNKALAPLGIEVTQFTILGSIAVEKARSASELADLVGVERSTLARNLERLVSGGLVEVVPGQGRKVCHRLTDRGRSLLSSALPLWQSAQDAIVSNLPIGMDQTIRADLRGLRQVARATLAEG